jgi:hypothetical protein
VEKQQDAKSSQTELKKTLIFSLLLVYGGKLILVTFLLRLKFPTRVSDEGPQLKKGNRIFRSFCDSNESCHARLRAMERSCARCLYAW